MQRGGQSVYVETEAGEGDRVEVERSTGEIGRVGGLGKERTTIMQFGPTKAHGLRLTNWVDPINTAKHRADISP